MSANTSIEWCDYTFAPWFGCAAAGPECENCYAEAWTVGRFHKAAWGPHAERVRAAANTLRQPLAWQRKAQREQVRRRVFCSELSDVFDNQVPEEWRHELWELIARCPDLDWLLLTKRSPNIRKMLLASAGRGWPNVWLGVTAGTQHGWHTQVATLRTVPARIRFVSVEPMLDPIVADLRGITWVICGVETLPPFHKKRGKVARPTNPDWARGLLRQCRGAGVPFFMKQMTNKAPIPDDLWVREWPR